jgi:hypothetical protein
MKFVKPKVGGLIMFCCAFCFVLNRFCLFKRMQTGYFVHITTTTAQTLLALSPYFSLQKIDAGQGKEIKS